MGGRKQIPGQQSLFGIPWPKIDCLWYDRGVFGNEACHIYGGPLLVSDVCICDGCPMYRHYEKGGNLQK